MVRTIQERGFVLADIRVVTLHIGIMAKMASCGGLEGDKILTRGGFVRYAIRKERAVGFPGSPELSVVCNRVLNDKRCNKLWV